MQFVANVILSVTKLVHTSTHVDPHVVLEHSFRCPAICEAVKRSVPNGYTAKTNKCKSFAATTYTFA